MKAHRPRAVSLLAALAALIAHDGRGGLRRHRFYHQGR
jgi:hypothetical protein